ncbi:Scr1 family TA system antitoxin-like transcriptional regulator [Streptomyces sp. NPDC048258]|uniref:Scr1 family TA system antitoxin-like transcriptional regulator n=1 Tax=Streptomyces sp. NPDC048258 TaxID=3365527 RepID=UPI00371498E1
MATARQLRFGAELRKLREGAGLNATEAAKQLGIRQTQISNLEAARIGASPERVRALAGLYGCKDQPYIDALAGMTGERHRGWWEEYRDLLPGPLLDLAELEHHSHSLRGAVTTHIPGLLQTAEHAREIFRHAVQALTPPDIEHRVSFRLKRQAVLYREAPVPYQALIHEAALRIPVGGHEVARAQLAHLLAMSEQRHVTIQVIPFATGALHGSGQSIYYATGPVPQLDTVHLDQTHGLVYLDAEEQLVGYRVLFERMEAAALSPQKSRKFIDTVAAEL